MAEHPHRTPFKIYKAILQTLNTDTSRINLVKRDQELILDGWEIYFAPDPYDIGGFCFPFPTTTLLKSLTERSIKEISKLQNGRYEVMYNVTNKPILLKPYEEELNNKLKWAQWSNFVSEDSEHLDKYLAALDIKTDGKYDETKGRLEDLADHYMSSLIAVVTGIVSIGIKRLSEVMRNLKPPAEWLEHSRSNELVLDEREEVVEEISEVFRRYFKNNKFFEESGSGAGDRSLSQRSQKRIDDNNLRDARAVDQLFQLNQIYNQRKQLILYFSSAAKSLYLDNEPKLKKYYPVIDGEPYDLVRTANDLFVYMVYKGDSENTRERTETARNRLKKLSKIIETIEEIRDAFEEASLKCLHCNQDVNQERCEYGPLCEFIKEFGEDIEQRQDLNVNYSLERRMANILEKTRRLPTPVKYRAILNTIQDILNEKGARKAKSQEMEVTLQNLLNRVDFASAFIRASRKEESRKVSCYLNSYPIFLSLKNEQLRQIVKKVIDLFNNVWSYHSFKLYVDEYLELDEQWPENAESELVRCFLYLIMGEVGKARQIAGIYLDNERDVDHEIRREFQYLMCFILWMADEHQKAIEAATESIELFDADGRFFHCRSVITLSLLDKQRDPKSYSYQDIVNDTLEASHRFSKASAFPMLSYKLGVCHNNLAYYFSELEFEMIDVPLAEEYLRKLTREIPEEDWDPPFPEFFHTKACVLYSKFVMSPLANNKEFLDEAFKSANKALIMYPQKEEHGKLVKIIETTYERFRITKPGSKGK